jgi:hypothetical protein
VPPDIQPLTHLRYWTRSTLRRASRSTSAMKIQCVFQSCLVTLRRTTSFSRSPFQSGQDESAREARRNHIQMAMLQMLLQIPPWILHPASPFRLLSQLHRQIRYDLIRGWTTLPSFCGSSRTMWVSIKLKQSARFDKHIDSEVSSFPCRSLACH